MGEEQLQQSFRPRFKGIENFLRRVAYNLGNTPSQTEVKIISCIPIDVTDLQHKIINLEKELAETRQESTGTGHKVSVVNTTLIPPLRIYPSSHFCATSKGARNPNSFSCSKHKNSSVSFLNPDEESYQCDHVESKHDEPACEAECDRLQAFIRKIKRKNSGKRRKKCNTQFVYYAQTVNSPFVVHDTADIRKDLPLSDALSRPYLADMIQKQYKPDRMVEELSGTSQFSSPICRDVVQSCNKPCLYDSDVYSCCHGPFHNVDKTAKHIGDIFTYPPIKINKPVNSYYDSSLYDVVPVREKAQNNEDISPKKILTMNQMEFKSFPRRSRVKPRLQPYPVNNVPQKRKITAKLPNRITPKQKFKQLRVNVVSSNTCSIDCGGVYMKALYGKRNGLLPRTPQVTQPLQPMPVLMKNAECLTISVNNTECQTASTKSVQLEHLPPEEDKTEATLNQIKTILQSVLTEVKTNSQIKNDKADTVMKDAVVQKGPSQGNIKACSSLMNSFTYSPYSMHPYGPSHSRQTNQLFYAGTSYPPGRCVQNYPLFIQTTGRQCTCCYRNIPSVAKSVHTRRAATTATDTEGLVPPQRSKETDKLIKEIYKSITLNMDYPSKDPSKSECGGLKSNNSKKVFEFKYLPNKEKRKEDSRVVVAKKDVRNTSAVPSFKTFGNNVVSNAASVRSQPVGKAMELRANRINNAMVSNEISSESDKKLGPRVIELPDGTSSSEDTETPESDEVESDDTVVAPNQPIKKKEKSSLFSKVAKLFKSKAKKQVEEERDETESESEEEQGSEVSVSDDYETVYSQHSRQQPRPRNVTYTYSREKPRYRPHRHSKASFSRYYMGRDRKDTRSPYMEQEYRRQWNENLAFHSGGTPKYSSERPFSGNSGRKTHKRLPYRQNYEARNASLVTSPYKAYDPVKSPVEDNRKKQMHQPKTAEKKALSWFKKHKGGIPCGEQWKRFVLEG